MFRYTLFLFFAEMDRATSLGQLLENCHLCLNELGLFVAHLKMLSISALPLGYPQAVRISHES
jgi:hypothetical protein